MLLLAVIITISTGIIFKTNKNTGNALLFIGFIIHAFILTSPLLLGITPVELNENNEVVKRTEGFLSFYQIMLLEILAYTSIALGFVLNAYSTIKNLTRRSSGTNNP